MNTVSKMALRVAAVMTLGAGFALAQPEINNLKAVVPFDFIVGHATLPAGEYVIEATPGSSIVQVRDAKGRVQATVLAEVASKPGDVNDSHLVFHVYGAKHFLATAWNGSTWMGKEFRKTAAERESEMAGVPERMTILLASK
ncbi:MAG TPA: hypothetical protein VFA04_18170 [Bryobacteraceae bacterium]|nr:hypothetical protein [Bryobacteraceae bacterium]